MYITIWPFATISSENVRRLEAGQFRNARMLESRVRLPPETLPLSSALRCADVLSTQSYQTNV